MKSLPNCYRLIWMLSTLTFLLIGCELHDPGQPGNLVPKTVDDDPNLPALTLSSTRLYYQTYGDPRKPVILMLHGGPGNDFRYMLPLKERVNGYSLTDDYYLVYFDQRSQGLSRRHSTQSELTLDIMLKDLEEVADHFSPNAPVILIGHSWGGTHAAQYTNAHPERVKGLVLMEPDGLTPAIRAAWGSTDVGTIDLSLLQDVTWSREFFTAEDHERADHALAVAFLAQKSRYKFPFYASSRAGFAAFWFLIQKGQHVEDYDFGSNLKNYGGKAMFIQGDLSKLSDKLQEGYNARLFKDYASKTFTDTDHEEMISNPVNLTITIETIKNYLQP
jgi:proline iminopeptidase